MSRLVRLAAIALVVLAACSDKSDPPVAAATTTSTAASSSPSTTFVGNTSPVSTPPGDARILAAVRVGAHEGFDRIVFEFDAGVPGYAVKYVDRPITEDGSGATVAIEGGAVLSVRFESASAHDVTTTRIKGPGGAIAEAVRTGDFEAVVNWAVGVRRKAPFHAYVSEGNKLVIDVAA
jgi:hypothetical protein